MSLSKLSITINQIGGILLGDYFIALENKYNCMERKTSIVHVFLQEGYVCYFNVLV